jgi:hypothetical protein
MNAAAKLTQTFAMDWNIYFNPALTAEQADFNGRTFEQWQKEGKDAHSVYADPLFADPEKFDFRLKDGSPALKLGFVPIDMTTVGPR